MGSDSALPLSPPVGNTFFFFFFFFLTVIKIKRSRLFALPHIFILFYSLCTTNRPILHNSTLLLITLYFILFYFILLYIYFSLVDRRRDYIYLYIHIHTYLSIYILFYLFYLFFPLPLPFHTPNTQTLMEIFPLVRCTVMASPCLCASALYSTLLLPYCIRTLVEDTEMSDLHPSTQRPQFRPPSTHRYTQ